MSISLDIGRSSTTANSNPSPTSPTIQTHTCSIEACVCKQFTPHQWIATKCRDCNHKANAHIPIQNGIHKQRDTVKVNKYHTKNFIFQYIYQQLTKYKFCIFFFYFFDIFVDE
jgi:hypothetical protein